VKVSQGIIVGWSITNCIQKNTLNSIGAITERMQNPGHHACVDKPPRGKSFPVRRKKKVEMNEVMAKRARV